ncbi:MAG: hypothetical protein NTW06_00900 [Candidatus Falkowbacteria bacterium]|nr:hypothetical protein [Candidatus Falkowbacteria bacterium]
MNKRIFILTVLIFFCIGLGIGMALQKIFFAKKPDPNDTYAAGWAAARQRIIDTGAFQGIGNNIEIKSIAGVVEEKENNIITIKTRPLEPLADPSLDERLVEVGSETKITAMIKKSAQQYQAEYNEALKNGNLKPIPGSPSGGITDYYNESASISQIEIGKQITIITNMDIRDKKEFMAEEILFGK